MKIILKIIKLYDQGLLLMLSILIFGEAVAIFFDRFRAESHNAFILIPLELKAAKVLVIFIRFRSSPV